MSSTLTIYERLKAIQGGNGSTDPTAQPSPAQPPADPAPPAPGREAWAQAYKLYARFMPEITAAAHDPEGVTVAGNVFQTAQKELAGLYAGGITGRRLAMAVFDVLADTYEAEKPLDQGEKQ